MKYVVKLHISIFPIRAIMIDQMNEITGILVFDPFCGASGDMVIGSLLSLGADRELVKDAMESAADVSVTISRVKKAQVSAVRVEVVQNSRSQYQYEQMVDQIRSVGLSAAVEDDVMEILNIIGRSESEVHHIPMSKLHLHEMGQQDAIADIVGAATAFHNLGPQDPQVFCMPISVGGGYAVSTHGMLPVPAPATLAILESGGLTWKGGPVEHELLTPTGAAILTYFTQRYGTSCTFYPQMTAIRTGCGAGAKDLYVPNVLRTVLGKPDESLSIDHIEMLETNVDDVTGEVLGYLIHELMDDGALDVSVIPATMKKGRSGHLIKVICRVGDSHRLAHRIMVETGSLGVRLIPVRHRLTARRKMMNVMVRAAGESHVVRVKVGCDNHGNILNVSAEFDDCKKIAKKTGLRIQDIIRMSREAARNQLD
jgi:uncharacterized protein (TIGR00299 family) protein